MEKKVKILLIVLGAAAVALVGMLALREPVQAPQDAPAPAQTKEQEGAKQDEVTKQEEGAPSRVTAVASGTVASVTDGSFILKTQDQEEMELKITEETSFYSMAGGKVEGKTKEDLRAGGSLVVEYDTATKEAVSVKIGK